jgi:hypothetical protein
VQDNEDAMSSASTHGGGSASGGSASGGPGTSSPGGGSGAGTPRLMVLPTDDRSRSFDSTTPHEVAAASVLLLAATAMKECGAAAAAAAAGGGGRSVFARDADDDNEEEARDEPERKKRKQAAAGIMRKKSNDASMASHVSPYSQSSATADTDTDSPKSVHTNNHAAADAATTATTTPVQDRRHHQGASPSSSYDLKDGQALHDSAKINDPKDIAALPTAQNSPTAIPPSHVEIPHFSSVLHAVLTESEFAGKVLLWLPHGQAWRIVRWDALRRQVLPKYFAQLNEDSSPSGGGGLKDSSSGASGSIDAFLWHLSAWGFKEINDGPDAGAYSHVVRASL